MDPRTTPQHLDLKRDEKLEVHWQDGERSVYSVSYLRSMCPCAMCKQVRQGDTSKTEQGKPAKPRLTILPGNYSEPIHVVSAELVGNYALRVEWSDQHGTGIYSFQYLREIAQKAR